MSEDVPTKLRAISICSLAMRIALAVAFLSAVADRFGLWGPPGSGNVAWGEFDLFLDYTALLLWFLPAAAVPWFGWAATIIEVLLAVGLLSGYFVRWFAVGSGILLIAFAAMMTIAFGSEPALSYSVWTAAAGAFLLAGVSDPDGSKHLFATQESHRS